MNSSDYIGRKCDFNNNNKRYNLNNEELGFTATFEEYMNRIESTPLNILEKYLNTKLIPIKNEGNVNYVLSMFNPKRILKFLVITPVISRKKRSLEKRLNNQN